MAWPRKQNWGAHPSLVGRLLGARRVAGRTRLRNKVLRGKTLDSRNYTASAGTHNVADNDLNVPTGAVFRLAEGGSGSG